MLLSGCGEPGAQRAEAALQASGVAWTNVRASCFNQNFSQGTFRDSILAGERALPAEPIPESFVDADDIADVVITALTGDGHSIRTLPLISFCPTSSFLVKSAVSTCRMDPQIHARGEGSARQRRRTHCRYGRRSLD